MTPGTKLDQDPEGLSGNGLQLSFSKEFCPLANHRSWWSNWEGVKL